MVCLRNICVNTLHKGDCIFTNNNNNNNMYSPACFHVVHKEFIFTFVFVLKLVMKLLGP
jgi:hypothetical protein